MKGVSYLAKGYLMPRIFISYRRVDSGAYAGRIYDRLKAAFGAENVFKDSYNIKPGMDFRGAIREAVGGCDVLLVLIGPDWLNVTVGDGTRRLDVPDDWLRLEIETGLQRDRAQVIPVLVGGASIPSADALPLAIRELAFKNAVTLHDDPYFDRDIEALIGSLRARDEQDAAPPSAPLPPAAPVGSAQSGSGNVQQNIGSVSNSTVIGNQTHNNYGGGSSPPGGGGSQGSGNGNGGPNRVVIWAAVVTGIFAVIVAVVQIVPDLLDNPTPTSVPTTEVPATDTAESPTDAPTNAPTDAPTATATETPTEEAAAPTDSSPQVTVGPVSVPPDNVLLTIFRDEDSFTLYAPAGSDLSGLEYRVVMGAEESVYRLENYAGFRGLPFADLPQDACFRLIRSGGTRPTPLQCTDGALRLTQQLVSADVFWRDAVDGVDRTVLVYRDAALAGTCAAGEEACEIEW